MLKSCNYCYVLAYVILHLVCVGCERSLLVFIGYYYSLCLELVLFSIWLVIHEMNVNSRHLHLSIHVTIFYNL
jgi:hypothetical protein